MNQLIKKQDIMIPNDLNKNIDQNIIRLQLPSIVVNEELFQQMRYIHLKHLICGRQNGTKPQLTIMELYRLSTFAFLRYKSSTKAPQVS